MSQNLTGACNTVYNPKAFERQTRPLAEAYAWGVGIISSVIGIAFIGSEYNRVLKQPQQPTGYLYLILLVISFLLVGAWVWVAHKELGLFNRWLDPRDYRVPDETPIVIGYAIFLIVLVFSSRNPIYFGFVFVTFVLATLVGTRHLNAQLRRAFAGSYDRLQDDKGNPTLAVRTGVYEQGIAVLEAYYLHRPALLRHLLITFFGVVALALAFYGKFVGVVVFEEAAYALYIATIVISEVIMFDWRVVRDRALDPLTVKLLEIERPAIRSDGASA